MNHDSQYRRSRTAHWVAVVGICAALIGAFYFGWPFLSFLTDVEQVEAVVAAAGAWGPVVFILMQSVQVIIAPIPGQVTALAGGYLFGPLWGLVYTTIGSSAGFVLVMFLARKLGRPFVERFVSPRALQKFDNLAECKGATVFLLIFLLPAFPDDAISFIAGLSTIPIKKLILISIIGRLPANAALSLTGTGLADHNLELVMITAGVSIVILAVAWWKRAWLQRLVDQFR